MAERKKKAVVNADDGPAVSKIKLHLDEVRTAVHARLNGAYYVEMTKAINRGLRCAENDARLMELYHADGYDVLRAFRVPMTGAPGWLEEGLAESGWIELSEFGHKWYWSLMVGGPIKNPKTSG